ncbi:uncharacterized protein LOC119100407 [Pollicipes pollicipes]|uniref:uncharacterized protein LOC119100407 n=1 Tax=Pollicipes pollicipes TaxID=41117 RepID=UPI0018855D9B|nr:uncharacterized protein LOC119100407 [Pollicipes pollicipes]
MLVHVQALEGDLEQFRQEWRQDLWSRPSTRAVRRLLVSRQRQLAVQPDGNGNLDQAPPQEGEKEEPDAADGADVAADEGEDEEPEAVLARLQQMTLEDGRCCQPAVPQTDVHIS